MTRLRLGVFLYECMHASDGVYLRDEEAAMQAFAGFSYAYAVVSCIAKRIRMKDDCASCPPPSCASGPGSQWLAGCCCIDAVHNCTDAMQALPVPMHVCAQPSHLRAACTATLITLHKFKCVRRQCCGHISSCITQFSLYGAAAVTCSCPRRDQPCGGRLRNRAGDGRPQRPAGGIAAVWRHRCF